jgi:hypothetical protein
MLGEDVSFNTEFAELRCNFENIDALLCFFFALLIVRRTTAPRSVVQVVLRLVPIELCPTLTFAGNLRGRNKSERVFQFFQEYVVTFHSLCYALALRFGSCTRYVIGYDVFPSFYQSNIGNYVLVIADRVNNAANGAQSFTRTHRPNNVGNPSAYSQDTTLTHRRITDTPIHKSQAVRRKAIMSTRVPIGKNHAIHASAVFIGPGRLGAAGMSGMIEITTPTTAASAITTALIVSVTPVCTQQTK